MANYNVYSVKEFNDNISFSDGEINILYDIPSEEHNTNWYKMLHTCCETGEKVLLIKNHFGKIFEKLTYFNSNFNKSIFYYDFRDDDNWQEERKILKNYNLIEVAIYNDSIEEFIKILNAYKNMNFRYIFLEKFRLTCKKDFEKILASFKPIKGAFVFVNCNKEYKTNEEIKKIIDELAEKGKFSKITIMREFGIGYAQVCKIVEHATANNILVKNDGNTYEIKSKNTFAEYLISLIDNKMDKRIESNERKCIQKDNINEVVQYLTNTDIYASTIQKVLGVSYLKAKNILDEMMQMGICEEIDGFNKVINPEKLANYLSTL